MHLPKIDPALHLLSSERFIIERSQELLSSTSIESYRLPLHNPKTLLIELNSVIKGYNSSEILKEEYAKLLADEATALFKNKTYLAFNSISLKFLQVALKKYSFQDILYASSLILADNRNYGSALFSKLQAVLTQLSGKHPILPSDFVELNEILKHFLIELHQTGYSKAYLHFFVTAIFKSPTAGTFIERLDIIGSMLTRSRESFQVIVGFSIKPAIADQLEILDSELVKLESSEIPNIIAATNRKVQKWFSNSQDNYFYTIELQARDYYSASNEVRKSLQLVLDVLYMGYSDEEFTLNSKCVVIGSVNPRKAGIHNFNYQLDGFFRNDQELYRQFSHRIRAIKESDLTPETLNRIESALRYLRIGSEVKELENKLLNYWIGMEYFFASNDSKVNKTTRMRDYFVRIDGKVYFKRLLLDFHQKINLFSLQTSVAGYNDNLGYLVSETNFQNIESNDTSPLLAFRALKLREKLFHRKNLTEELERHRNKVEWNLVRIYRIRNAVVHSAVGNTNILDISSHLRYYLIFAINSAVDYFNNNPVDVNGDGIYNLEDFFLVNKVEFDNFLMDETQDITKVLAVRNPVEFLS